MSVQKLVHSTSHKVHDGVDAFTASLARVARGTVAGFFGGLVASWMMEQYKMIESQQTAAPRRAEERLTDGAQPKAARSKSAQGKSDTEAPAVKVAEHVSRKLFEQPNSRSQQNGAGQKVQYRYGAYAGAVYGGLSELLPSVSSGFGVPYAALLWLFGSEAASALGLSKPMKDVPPEEHASAIATHFVYGLSLDISRRILRLIL